MPSLSEAPATSVIARSDAECATTPPSRQRPWPHTSMTDIHACSFARCTGTTLFQTLARDQDRRCKTAALRRLSCHGVSARFGVAASPRSSEQPCDLATQRDCITNLPFSCGCENPRAAQTAFNLPPYSTSRQLEWLVRPRPQPLASRAIQQFIERSTQNKSVELQDLAYLDIAGTGDDR